MSFVRAVAPGTRILHAARPMIAACLAGVVLSATPAVHASPVPTSLADCAAIVDNGQRLACFDQLAAQQVQSATAATKQPEATGAPARVDASDIQSSTGEHPASPVADASSDQSSVLSEHWELDRANKHGLFRFRPHQPNFLLATYTDSPNSAPYQPFRPLVLGRARLSHAELSYQLGFKMKFAENLAGTPADLWFGYTQQSFWQAGNREASSPFRETNYQPEVMAVIPLKVRLPGAQLRFINFGVVHQSNGQSSTLSRSWNRFYVQAGLEGRAFTLVGRVWKRWNEDPATDDNPDIIDYLGHGDLVGTYRWRGHEFSLLTRYNFGTDKGAAQLGWAFPIAEHLKGYVQLFSGYGHSLIDYNHSQNVIGAGLLVSY